MNKHEFYMQRCLQLAELGRGQVAPNPMVGAVIVYNGKIIGEGYHQKCGEAHAEVNAIKSVKDKDLLKQSTLYVSLEPCAHFGRTPACSLLIIQHQIPRVVIACTDAFEKVDGKGIRMLKQAGIEVVLGVLEQEALDLNKRFFTFHARKRPYIILKWAQTQDGFIDYERTTETPQPAWITNEVSRSLVHKWRTEEPSILVGTQTAIKDNPQLNVRAWTGKSPIRITFDRHLQIPTTHYLLDDTQPTLVFTEQNIDNHHYKQTKFIRLNKDENLNNQILSYLYDNGIQSLIVEGGKEVLDSFIDQQLWDEALVFTGSVEFKKGIKAPVFDYQPSKIEYYREVVLKKYINPN